MNIRVECPCGQAYSFDVEPVNNLMPCAVVCPDCGADGTELANQVIASAVAPQIPARAPAAPVSRLRIDRPAPSAPAPGAYSNPAPPVPPVPGYTRAYEPPKPPMQGNKLVLRGILGGVVGGGVAMACWYFLTMATEREFGFAAWFLGIITGVSVRLFARDGSPVLGYIAAVCATVAILGGEFLVTNSFINKATAELAGVGETTYNTLIKEANEGVKLQSDAEIKAWLQTNDDSGEQVTTADIANFRKVRQPKMQDLLNGKPPKSDFTKAFTAMSLSDRFGLFKASLTLFTLLWVGFGVASAWRIASG